MGVDYALVYAPLPCSSFIFSGLLTDSQTPHLYDPAGGSLDLSLPSAFHRPRIVQDHIPHHGLLTSLSSLPASDADWKTDCSCCYYTMGFIPDQNRDLDISFQCHPRAHTIPDSCRRALLLRDPDLQYLSTLPHP